MKRHLLGMLAGGLVVWVCACGKSNDTAGGGGASTTVAVAAGSTSATSTTNATGATNGTGTGATSSTGSSTGAGGASGVQISIVTTIDLPGAPFGMAFNPTTKKAYFGCVVKSDAGFDVPAGIAVVDDTTNAITSTITTLNDVFTIAVNPTTNTIYAVDSSGFIDIIDGATDTIKGTIQKDVNDLVVDATHNVLYALYGAAILVIDGATNNVTATYPVDVSANIDTPNGYHSLAIDATTQTLFIAGQNTKLANTVIVLDATNGNIKSTTSPASYPQNVIAIGGGSAAIQLVGSPNAIEIAPTMKDVTLPFTPTAFGMTSNGLVLILGYDANGAAAGGIYSPNSGFFSQIPEEDFAEMQVGLASNVLGGVMDLQPLADGGSFDVTAQPDPETPGPRPHSTIKIKVKLPPAG